MQELADMELLGHYVREHSDEAFAAVVTRHVGLVYSAALRKTGNPHAAAEITQAVFIILARKAPALRPRTVLTGWLYQTTRLTAANFLRTEIRRVRRDQEAYMQSLPTESHPEIWPQITPLLEDAMGRLGEKDRDAIALRFFEGRDFKEVGVALGTGEDAAKMRVQRALEKLRKFFAKRGVSSTTSMIAGAMAAHSVQAAPVALAQSATVAAIGKGSMAAASTLTLVSGTMKIMNWIKIKFAIGVCAAVLLAGGVATVALSDTTASPPTNRPTNLAQGRQVFVATVFLKVPTAGVDAVVNDFTNLQTLMRPNSPAFKALLARHPEADFLGAPSVLVAAGNEGSISVTKPVAVGGTNADIGIVLDVTPAAPPGSRISLKIRSELRELVDGPVPSLRVTESDQTQTFQSATTPLVLRQDIETPGQTVGKEADDGSKTFLVFLNATSGTFQQRLQKIIHQPAN